jgi:hypothetical protein
MIVEDLVVYVAKIHRDHEPLRATPPHMAERIPATASGPGRHSWAGTRPGS